MEYYGKDCDNTLTQIAQDEEMEVCNTDLHVSRTTRKPMEVPEPKPSYTSYTDALQSSNSNTSRAQGGGLGNSSYQPSHSMPLNRGRGRGRMSFSQRPHFNRGRGARNNYRQPQYARRPQDKMSHEDRKFIYGEERHRKDGFVSPKSCHTAKSPKANTSTSIDTEWPNTLNLSESERKGLALLGFTPDSEFVKTIFLCET